VVETLRAQKLYLVKQELSPNGEEGIEGLTLINCPGKGLAKPRAKIA